MADIVNLRRARKARARTEAAAIAEANRARHAVPKKQRRLNEQERAKLKRDIDAKKLDSDL